MSKEETPKTYVIDLVNPNDITHRNNCIIRKGCDWTESEKEIIQKALNGDLITKEEAQAKVLEALESLPRYDIDSRGNFQHSKNGALIPYWAVEKITKHN